MNLCMSQSVTSGIKAYYLIGPLDELRISLRDVMHGLELKVEYIWFIWNKSRTNTAKGSIGVHMLSQEKYDLVRQAQYRDAISVSHTDGERDQRLERLRDKVEFC